MLELGLKLGRLGLDACAALEELVALVREAARRTPEGQWIIGEGWNESLFAEGRLPSRHDPDEEIKEIRVDLTVVGGRVAHRRA